MMSFTLTFFISHHEIYLYPFFLLFIPLVSLRLNSCPLLIIWLDDSWDTHFSDPSTKLYSMGIPLTLPVNIQLLPSTLLSSQPDINYNLLQLFCFTQCFVCPSLPLDWTILRMDCVVYSFSLCRLFKIVFYLCFTHGLRLPNTLWMTAEHIWNVTTWMSSLRSSGFVFRTQIS